MVGKVMIAAGLTVVGVARIIDVAAVEDGAVVLVKDHLKQRVELGLLSLTHRAGLLAELANEGLEANLSRVLHAAWDGPLARVGAPYSDHLEPLDKITLAFLALLLLLLLLLLLMCVLWHLHPARCGLPEHVPRDNCIARVVGAPLAKRAAVRDTGATAWVERPPEIIVFPHLLSRLQLV